MNLFFLWITGAFCVASTLTTWFKSTMSIHVYQLIWSCKKTKPDNIKNMTKDDWAVWNAMYLPPLLDELLSCPKCLSWHVSFWTALSMHLIHGNWFLTITCVCSWPAASLLIFEQL